MFHLLYKVVHYYLLLHGWHCKASLFDYMNRWVTNAPHACVWLLYKLQLVALLAEGVEGCNKST
jgi:hypothetical protein